MTDKDWKFKIALDTKCRDEVVRFTKSLPKEAREIYRELIRAYSGTWTISNLLDLIDDEPERRMEFLVRAYAKIHDVVYTPDILYWHLKDRIQYDQDLEKILDISMKNGRRGYISWDAMLAIFGSTNIDYIPVATTYKKTIPYPYDRMEILGEFKNKCQDDVGYFDLRVKEGTGFSEYTGSECNYFEVYQNECDLDKIYKREINPGRAQLYRLAKQKTYDAGATSLFYGWALHCSGNLDLYYNFIYPMTPETIIRECVRLQLPEWQMWRILICKTQYHGLLETAIRAALWFRLTGGELPKTDVYGELFKLWKN